MIGSLRTIPNLNIYSSEALSHNYNSIILNLAKFTLTCYSEYST